MYSLGNTDLSIYGFTAVRQDGSDAALSGFLDMPSRLGKTFHDWANEDGIEPYVSASEIFFGGRDLKLTGVITGTDLYDCNAKLAAMYAHFDSFSGLVPLVSNWGTNNVYINAAVTGEYLSDEGLKVTIPMHEPYVPMTGTVPAGESAEFGINGISFASLGGAFLELKGDRWNRPAPKKIDVTAYGKEAYMSTRKEVSTLDMKLGIKAGTYAELKSKVNNLMALLAAPGMKSLTVNNDKIRSFFVKDGFIVTELRVNSDPIFCVVECKLTESGSATKLEALNIKHSEITINGQTITLKVKI